MNNQLMQNIGAVLNMAKSGRSPKDIMDMYFRSNPQFNQMMTQLQNMAQGRTPQEFITQLARQNGVDQSTIDQLVQLIGRR
jgi:predicted metal-dependent phosphotriesterase family hydrolase